MTGGFEFFGPLGPVADNLTVGIPSKNFHSRCLHLFVSSTNTTCNHALKLTKPLQKQREERENPTHHPSMGCVSSKCIRDELKQEQQQQQQQRHVTLINNNGGATTGSYSNHVVSLTSSTYGALKLDRDSDNAESKRHKRSSSSPTREEPEVINAWELMEGLDEEPKQPPQPPISTQLKKSPKSTPFLRGFKANADTRSPLKFLNQFGSPKTVKKSTGKENRVQVNGLRGGVRRLDYSPKGVLKTANSCPNTCRSALNSGFQAKGSPISAKRNSFGSDSGLQRKSPLFDPELVASYEKELSEEHEQIKRMVWATPKARSIRKSLDSNSLLQTFEKKCPPGGENAVVIYTTTLRGIRKTFEDCNKVRTIVDSYCVQVIERDVSMDSGFKEELRKLMETKEVKVPVVFVKGRLVGGAEEVVKLEEEEKLGALFEGIPKRLGVGCEGCGGVRFVMCVECNGSCKVLDGENKKKTVRCGQCNENGIVQCPLCSMFSD